MPGILYHLSFAEEVYRKLSLTTKIDKIRFMAGNLIPDLATEKSTSHYQIEASINSFFIPDMEIVKKELFSQEDELKLGMYCHLFLDYYFIEHYLIPSFIWDLENNKITNSIHSNRLIHVNFQQNLQIPLQYILPIHQTHLLPHQQTLQKKPHLNFHPNKPLQLEHPHK